MPYFTWDWGQRSKKTMRSLHVTFIWQTSSKWYTDTNSRKSTAWTVPNAFAQQYHSGSGNHGLLFRAHQHTIVVWHHTADIAVSYGWYGRLVCFACVMREVVARPWVGIRVSLALKLWMNLSVTEFEWISHRLEIRSVTNDPLRPTSIMRIAC